MFLLLPLALAGTDALERARAAERRGDIAAELLACREIADHPRCATRLGWIEARRDADGSLTGLSQLEAARRITDPVARRSAVSGIGMEGRSPALQEDLGRWMAQDSSDLVGRGGWPERVLGAGVGYAALCGIRLAQQRARPRTEGLPLLLAGLFPAFVLAFLGDSSLAWRALPLIPGLLALHVLSLGAAHTVTSPPFRRFLRVLGGCVSLGCGLAWLEVCGALGANGG